MKGYEGKGKERRREERSNLSCLPLNASDEVKALGGCLFVRCFLPKTCLDVVESSLRYNNINLAITRKEEEAERDHNKTDLLAAKIVFKLERRARHKVLPGFVD